uniref:Uncharacterized protein n=1 Tax=Panagrellus redivivus TaxID=6233 RepID=A0A7E4ZT13_PANRE
MIGLNTLNYYCDRNNGDDAEWYPCPVHEKRPRLFFYETHSTYIGIAISFAYAVTALLLYMFGMPDAELLLLPALLTNLPHLFRRFLDYVPLLFRQIFYNWAYLIYNLTLLWLFPKIDSLLSTFEILKVIFAMIAIFVHPVLSRLIYYNFKEVCLSHWLGPLKLRHFWIHPLLTCINVCACLRLLGNAYTVARFMKSIHVRVSVLITVSYCILITDTFIVSIYTLVELMSVGCHLYGKYGVLTNEPMAYEAYLLDMASETSKKRK